MGAGNQQGSPREQQMLLTAELSPQPLVQTLKAPKDALKRPIVVAPPPWCWDYGYAQIASLELISVNKC